MMATGDTAIQLRDLQTLAELGVEKNTTIVFPLPIDLLEICMKPGMTRADRVAAAAIESEKVSDQLSLPSADATLL